MPSHIPKQFRVPCLTSHCNIGYLTWVITRRYGLLRGPTSSSCKGLRHSTETFFIVFPPIQGHLLCTVIISVTFSCNLSNWSKEKTAKKIQTKIFKNKSGKSIIKYYLKNIYIYLYLVYYFIFAWKKWLSSYFCYSTRAFSTPFLE